MLQESRRKERKENDAKYQEWKLFVVDQGDYLIDRDAIFHFNIFNFSLCHLMEDVALASQIIKIDLMIISLVIYVFISFCFVLGVRM